MRRLLFFTGAIAFLLLLTAWSVLERPTDPLARERQVFRVHAAVVLFPLLASLTTLKTARAYRPGDRERRVWLGLSGACGLWALGRAAFAYAHFLGVGSMGWMVDAFTVAFCAILLLAVGEEIRLLRELRLLGVPQLAFLAAVGVAALAVGIVLFLEPIVGQGPRTAQDLVGLVLAALAVLLVPVVLAPAAAFLGGLWGYTWGLLSVGMLCLAAGILWWVNAAYYGVWFEGHPTNLLQISGFALMSVGALWHEAAQ